MPRMSKEAKAASHARIVEEASRLFRERGIEATSVGELMEAAGLTHGGFYRHFSSKEELACAAINQAVDQIASKLEEELAEYGAPRAIVQYVGRYLSDSHVSNPGTGCPFAALGEEAGRGPAIYKDAISRGEQRILDLLSEGFQGEKNMARAAAISLQANLIGTLVMARSTNSKSFRNATLAAGRSFSREYIEARAVTEENEL